MTKVKLRRGGQEDKGEESSESLGLTSSSREDNAPSDAEDSGEEMVEVPIGNTLSDLRITPDEGRCLVLGHSGSGKSTLIRNIVRELVKTGTIAGVFWFGMSHDDERAWIPAERRAPTLSEERIKAMVACQKMAQMKKYHVVCVLDDVSSIKSHNNKLFDALASVASRHHRIFLIVGLQQLTQIAPSFRTNLTRMFCTSASNDTITQLHKQSKPIDYYQFQRYFEGLGRVKGEVLYVDKSTGDISKIRVPKLDPEDMVRYINGGTREKDV